jgi:hypothetical protein
MTDMKEMEARLALVERLISTWHDREELRQLAPLVFPDKPEVWGDNYRLWVEALHAQVRLQRSLRDAPLRALDDGQ